MVARTQFEVVDDNIIIARLTGTFSTQAGIALYKSFREIVEKQTGPFAIVMELTHFMGSTPEGYAEAEAFNQWLLSKPLVAKVNVKAMGITQKIVDKQIPTRRKLNVEEFDTLESAIQFLQTKLANYA